MSHLCLFYSKCATKTIFTFLNWEYFQLHDSLREFKQFPFFSSLQYRLQTTLNRSLEQYFKALKQILGFYVQKSMQTGKICQREREAKTIKIMKWFGSEPLSYFLAYSSWHWQLEVMPHSKGRLEERLKN